MSLVEIMVVIAILLTLMSVLAYGVFQIFGQAQGQMTSLQMTKVAEQIDIYMLRKKHPPSTSEGLAAVFGNEAPPKDQWDHEFIYVSPGPNGKPYDLISYGKDGVEGGDDDIHLSDVQ
jgi:general secretion pathway protein G